MINFDKLSILKKWIETSNNIVFFGGAGVSTESGIPDFRSQNGLYNLNISYPPEEILSLTFFKEHTEEFFDFYRKYLLINDIKPNHVHYYLADLERKGKLSAIVTQNIDNLHYLAGSKKVFELHGSICRNFCLKCKKFYEVDKLKDSTEVIPRCDCGGIIKPDVVLYEENLNNDLLSSAINAIKRADLLIVGGTSLSVYPAASLINYYKGNKLVLINKTRTHYDDVADLIFYNSIGDIFQLL